METLSYHGRPVAIASSSTVRSGPEKHSTLLFPLTEKQTRSVSYSVSAGASVPSLGYAFAPVRPVQGWMGHQLIPPDTLHHIYFLAFELAIAVIVWSVFAGWPQTADRWIRPAAAMFSRVAARRKSAVALIFVATLGLRLALLPVLGIPVPGIHDEFSYILSGDTFAHGRLTNPTPPSWQSFDTFHTLLVPTYASMYPPAQGMFLAFGELLGCQWLGVLFSVALFCAAVVWAFQAWMPPRWALLGGVMVMFNIGVVSYWVNSYWGGAVSALGGALVLGAVPRILKWGRAGDSLLLGAGIFLLANSRPLEGLLYVLPFAILLAVRAPRNLDSRVRMRKVVYPLAASLTLTVAFVGYYNWRVTGDAFTMPHLLRDRMYAPAARFIWEKPRLEKEYRYANPQFEDFYVGFECNHYRRTVADLLHTLWDKLWSYSDMFLWVGALPALLCVPLLSVNRYAKILLAIACWCGLGLASVQWDEPHYAGPVTATLCAIIVYALRRLTLQKMGRRPVGRSLAYACIVLLILSVPAMIVEKQMYPGEYGLADPFTPTWTGNVPRTEILAKLAHSGGRHLIFVRYGPDHNVHKEWVFNGADIADSAVLWVRDLDLCQNQEVGNAFRDRHLWLLEPDLDPPRLAPFQLSQTACTANVGESN